MALKGFQIFRQAMEILSKMFHLPTPFNLCQKAVRSGANVGVRMKSLKNA